MKEIDRTNNELIVDVTDNSNIAIINLESVADSVIENYFKNGTYEKLPLDSMKRVYKFLIDLDYDCYKLNSDFMIQREFDLEASMIFSSALFASIIIGVGMALTGNAISIFAGWAALIGCVNFETAIHERRDKKTISCLIDEIAKEYCLLPASDFKRLEQLRNENVVTKELIELVRKEASLKEEYDRLEVIKQEDNYKKLIEEGINKASQQVDDNLTILNDLIDEKYKKIKKHVVPRDMLFTEVDGITKINEDIKVNLKYIDLSFVDFTNVDVSGVDFSDCNPILLDPQTVYNKDLSNTIFINDRSRVNNVFPFGATTNFNGVNLTNAQIISEEPIIINFDGFIIDGEPNITIGNNPVKMKKMN